MKKSKILNLLIGVSEIAKVSETNIDTTVLYPCEVIEIVRKEINNYDKVIVPVWLKAEFKNDNKVVSGRDFISEVGFHV